MPEVTLRHEIDCDEDTFWEKCFLNEDYMKVLFLDELKLLSFKVLEQKDDGKVLTRKVRIESAVVGVPGPVKKVIGEKLAYVEDGRFDRATKRFTFKILTDSMGDKSRVGGELWVEKLGEKKIARIAKISVEVKIFMVGSFIEDRIVSDLKTSYAQAAQFTSKYVKDKAY
jgi:hypothetical protein